MTWQVFFIEGVVVNLDLGESSEVVRHEHDGHIDVLQLPGQRCQTPPQMWMGCGHFGHSLL